MDQIRLALSLADAFNALADQVQILADRKTVLEHKLRFAHEQIAVIIRDGRRMASKIVSAGSSSKTTCSSRESVSRPSQDETSMSTALEQDFTVQGKRGSLQCPFSKRMSASGTHDGKSKYSVDTTPHSSADPICAAMLEEATSQPAPNGAGSSKCPIRFLDKHSPEEIAHYVETHKHALPRSHEVCLRRYQRNETQMKKLDSKYGNIVSMIEGLSHLHQPMLPESETPGQPPDGAESGGPNKRVENWAQTVSRTGDLDVNHEAEAPPSDADRQSHFDRPLKEVRVGESPSRPWGISVPVYEPSGHGEEYPHSPPPAPVRMSDSGPPGSAPERVTSGGKCPFDHGKFSGASIRPPPFTDVKPPQPVNGFGDAPLANNKGAATTSTAPDPTQQPAFISPCTVKPDGAASPHMIFTGPVFIGYPIEQAIQFALLGPEKPSTVAKDRSASLALETRTGRLFAK
ncbi:hypothetical protein UVI_02004670 [Ustilaginoidea virens]|uniref:Uncharacterized protein n=1 Tax=Ustilaginoidea virens TaxID=1159556 RepID=A0A1B5KSF0_USTVR|nr:hypothetical protein UVI_02004670 [Ustilaginoidea virens]